MTRLITLALVTIMTSAAVLALITTSASAKNPDCYSVWQAVATQLIETETSLKTMPPLWYEQTLDPTVRAYLGIVGFTSDALHADFAEHLVEAIEHHAAFDRALLERHLQDVILEAMFGELYGGRLALEDLVRLIPHLFCGAQRIA